MTINTINATMCASVVEWNEKVPASDWTEKNGHTYDVSYRHEGNPQWECSCPSFKYSRTKLDGKGECKHIKAAQHFHCQYGIEGLAGSPADLEPHDPCPICGLPTITMKVKI